jgi:hypothetical protein
MEDKKFAIYNIDKDSVYGLIPFPLAAKGYLSSDAKYVIIEETPWTLPNYQDTHPGRISVFNGVTGQLIQKLILPTDGKVLVFDNYPNRLYYYLPNEQRSINIELSRFAPITSLNPVSASAGSPPFTLTVRGRNFANGSTVNWNGTARTTTFVADSLLQANILASDVAAADSPLVTVKSPDGSAESNGIRFMVLRQQTMLEMIEALRIQLQQSYSAGTLGNQQFRDELDKCLVNAKTDYQAKDSIGSAQDLESFQQLIRLVYLSKSRPGDKRYAGLEACTLLFPSAQGIVERILTLPPHSSGNIFDQIAALQAQLKSDASDKRIGGTLLIPGLNAVLDAAKKEIQKKDSLATALQLQLFRATVKDVYALTKTRAVLGTYVKAAGYISLYYRARYILDQLPEPIGAAMPKLDAQLEQELKEAKESQ